MEESMSGWVPADEVLVHYAGAEPFEIGLR